MARIKNYKKLIERFKAETGYTEYTNISGIRKDYKRGDDWQFKNPSDQLVDFLK